MDFTQLVNYSYSFQVVGISFVVQYLDYLQSLSGVSLCLDINECDQLQPCEHICTNILGGFECSCDPGYTVSPTDNTKCEGQSVKLSWSSEWFLQAVSTRDLFFIVHGLSLSFQHLAINLTVAFVSGITLDSNEEVFCYYCESMNLPWINEEWDKGQFALYNVYLYLIIY